MLIAVGSTNKTKTGPVQEVFSKHFKNAVTRFSGVAYGVAFALAPFLHPDIY